MYKDKKILAVITARGGSKGLPGKNINNLYGKPLIAWTIQKAQVCKLIDHIFISTDSKDIADVCEEYGVKVPELRPHELAKDTTSSMDVLLYTIEKLEKRGDIYDYLLLLEPTSPLRKRGDLDKIISIAVDHKEADGVISVGKVHTEHPGIVKRISDEEMIIPYIENNKTVYQRQQEDEALFPYGVGYLVKIDRFKECKTIYMEHMLPYYIERWQNYEIDDIYDFKCIETIIEMKGMEI